MTPSPSGVLRSTATGVDLELRRSCAAGRTEVWATLTESPRTALWFGPWESLADKAIRVRMAFEDGEPDTEMHVLACEPPSRLDVSMNGDGNWHLEVLLTERNGGTDVLLVHHDVGIDTLGEIGPGWEFYLDMFVGAIEGTRRPEFDEYYPSQQAYYVTLTK